MVAREARAHGLPVVVSGRAHCGISRELTPGEQALLLDEPTNAVQLAALLASVLQQPALAAQLRRHGLTFAQQHSWAQAALQYEALYQHAVAPQSS